MLVVRSRPRVPTRNASPPRFLVAVRSLMISSGASRGDGGRKRGFSAKSEDSKPATAMPTTPTAAAISKTEKPSPSPWTPLGLSRDELELDYTLPTGQSFRWRKTGLLDRNRVFTGVVGRRIVQLSHVGGGAAAFRVLADASGSPSSAADDLSDYFNSGVSLAPMAEAWAAGDDRWRSASRVARGARVLRQPPLECLLSFICSSNNSIPRITGMVEHLARAYGTELASADEAARLLSLGDDDFGAESEKPDDDGAPSTPSPSSALSRSGAPPRPDAPFYAFPTLDELVGRVNETDLREAGFGYRARYVVGAVEALASLRESRGDGDFLLSLREASQERALEELARLPGVGPKVAACVALFSLDKHAVVPVDTHVWQLAARHYLPSIRGKAFSPAAGHLVSTALAEKFGPFAGWAHNALFIAELPGVRDEVARREREEKRKRRGGGDDESDESDSEEDERPKRKASPKKRTTMASKRAEESAAVLSEMTSAVSKPGTPSKEV